MTKHFSTWGTASEVTGAPARFLRRPLARSAVSVFALLLSAGPVRAETNLPLRTLLDRVGQQVEKFWNYFPAVTCTEQVSQAKLNAKGKALLEQRAAYDYLILLQSAGTRLSVEESRVLKRHQDPKGKASLLLTNGFSILTLIFHPMYQSSYEFSVLPDEVLGGRKAHRIAFRHLGQNRSPSVLVVHQREYPLEWKGIAWIDPDSYAIMRIEAGLATSMEDMGLLQLNAEVNYAAMHFSGVSSDYWLPTRAVIEALTKRQHWRNIHLFTDYRRFNVETEVRTGTPQ